MIPPGLTCAHCRHPFDRALARRTRDGWIHATACTSPSVLGAGQWVTVRGIARWVPERPPPPPPDLTERDRRRQQWRASKRRAKARKGAA